MITSDDFGEAVEMAFASLADHAGLIGPLKMDSRVVYASTSPSFQVRFRSLHWDEGGYARTSVQVDSFRSASVEGLFVAAGLGPVQRVHTVARTMQPLRVALDSQSSAIRACYRCLKAKAATRSFAPALAADLPGARREGMNCV